ncbi:hypothetical protein [Hymenobacter pini]|uniref:hypothetical protein n=1 Tax=Hymenobacter pini TaxID=2880879 RepID=UPI001CF289F1|nr:hypothetical protein [Hymenobacter pini]MCA8831063.1 hypothetical protein [Hymenobacter pini]
MDLLEALLELLSAANSLPANNISGVGVISSLLVVPGMIFLGVSAVQHPISLLRFGLGFLAALLLGFGVAYGLFRANITGSYRPGAFVLFVTTMAMWFMGGALWFVR